MTPEHYKGKHTIDKQEIVMKGLIQHGIDPCRAFSAVTALKYFDRAGDKPHESTLKDLAKACNYLNRAITGKWPWEEEKQ